MPRCPACGSEVAADVSNCPTCGESPIAGAADGGRESFSGDGRAHGEGNRRRGGGWSRRKLLQYGGGAAVVGLGAVAGGLVLTGDDGGNGPGATTREFVTAYFTGDTETAGSLIAESFRNTLQRQKPSLDEEDLREVYTAADAASENVNIESVDVRSRSGDSAEIEVEVRVEERTEPPAGPILVTVDLETRDGEWKVVTYQWRERDE